MHSREHGALCGGRDIKTPLCGTKIPVSRGGYSWWGRYIWLERSKTCPRVGKRVICHCVKL